MVLNSKAFVTAAICTAGALLLLAMGCGLFGPPAPQRVEVFNHAAHAAKGITCGACHQDYETEDVAGMPAYGTCLACHGTADNIPEAVKRKLAADYPNDRATGYAPGQIRGAVTVKKPLN